MWFETHAHLSDAKFDPDRDEVIERAFANSVTRIIEIADGPEEWEKARLLSEKYPGKIWWAAGLHPYFADQASDAVFKSLRDFATHPQFVALGEVGLDYAKCPIPPERQKQTLASVLQLAREIDKPLIIHCREAFEDLMTIFRLAFDKKNSSPSPGVVHCFSGSKDQAEELVQMGFFLGVDGPVTYPNSNILRETLSHISPQKLVLETDSPYLPPQNYRGKRNEPGYLPLIGDALSKIMEMDPKNMATILRQNSCALFRLN
jgi:TatD DNase family protein